MPRVLITGGAGFLGSHLAARFLAEGYDVLVLDNLITGTRRNLAHLAGNPRFEFVEHDVTRELRVEGEIEGVLHLASPASPVDYHKLPIETLRVGSLGTLNTLELARTKDARYFLASTSEVYGDPVRHPQDEGYWGNVNPTGPRAVYDEAKRFSEAAACAYERHHAVEVRIARIFNTFGPAMRPHDGRVVSNFIRQALKGEPITVYGDGTQTRSLCYVSDEVDGLYRLYESDVTGPVNIGNPEEWTVAGIAQRVLKLTGSSSPIVFMDLPQDDPKQRRPDITRARELLGWEPRVSVDEGLLETIDYFRSLLGDGQLPSRVSAHIERARIRP